MLERDNNGLPPELRDATRVLREAPEPNDLWRQRLLREIEATPRPRAGATGTATARRWSLRPITAIAAGIACMLIGGATVATVMSDPSISTHQPPASSLQPPTSNLPPPTSNLIRFTLVAPAASHVSIVGDFNGWNPQAQPLRRSADGRTWEIEVPLAPGRYAYSFVVDGALARDPGAPQARDEDLGTTNSVIMVRGS